MAGLQSWRRHTQLARPADNAHIYHGHINDGAPSDDTSYSTSPGADESKLRPRRRRSLATFASYLGTHHRTISPSSGSEWPSIDWSKLSITDKDGDYKWDIEIMCTTITQQVLANPSTDLPAQYNTFLLHLIEAYHQSKVDVRDLQMKLAEQTKSNKNTEDGIHGETSSWPLEKTQMPESHEGPEYANPNTLHSTRSAKGVTSTRVRRCNSTLQMPSSSIDKGKRGKKQEQTDKIKIWDRHQWMSSASRHREPCTIAVGIESSHDQWPPLHLQRGMELNDCDQSSPESEGEGPGVLMSASDAFLGLENDVISRIAGWLALRLNCQPSDVIAEVSELIRSTQDRMQNGLVPITSGTARRNTPNASGIIFSETNQTLRGRPDKLIGTNGSLSCQPIREPRHRRGFSFLPGDDCAGRIVSNVGDQALDSETSFSRPLAWQDTKHSENGESSESSKDELSGVMAGGSKSQQGLTTSVVSSTAGSDVSRNPQRDGSGNSFHTAMINSSGRSSSRSHRVSLCSNVENNSLRVDSSRPRNSHLAVAAARAAKNGIVDKGAFCRESSS